ncbi:sodium:solute symporter family protein [Chromohalobacter israelensis]|uniref:sodium:solute symporter family protein n=1 Tax=Chromohalobacter israelensis TaxID=141390 RepID=UPI000D70F8DD|nr:sodium:solute symporter family protein [Chromohalobacter salexigens]PWW41945.1 SSS family solute:Na+ symporter [Chromohalobacter salexigens]
MTSSVPFWITLGYLGVAILLGLRARAGRSMNSLEEWGVAGRSLGPVMLYLLIAAGSVSAYTFMGAPGWAYTKGVAVFYVVIYLSYLALVAWYFGPKVWAFGRRFGHVTQGAAIADRYESPLLGGLAAAVMSIASLAYAVLQTIGSAYILHVMSGGRVPVWTGVLVVLLGIAVYLYASGQRAIGVTNAFQGVLMLAVAWAVGLWASQRFGGGPWFGDVFATLRDRDPRFLTLPGAQGDMSFAFWTTSIIVSMLSFMPPVWTQWMSASSARTIRRSATWLPSYYVVILPMVVVGFIGIYSLPELARADTVALELAMQQMPVWLVGLLGAGTLAASMSSCEPFLHSVALSYAKDIAQPALRLSDARTGALARYLLVPIMAFIVAPVAIAEPDNLVMILLVGLGFATQVLPAFIGMFFWTRASKWGVLAGIVAGFSLTLAFTLAWRNPLGVHAGFWGLLVNLPIFVLVSCLTRPASSAVTERFFAIAAPGWRAAGDRGAVHRTSVSE